MKNLALNDVFIAFGNGDEEFFVGHVERSTVLVDGRIMLTATVDGWGDTLPDWTGGRHTDVYIVDFVDGRDVMGCVTVIANLGAL